MNRVPVFPPGLMRVNDRSSSVGSSFDGTAQTRSLHAQSDRSRQDSSSTSATSFEGVLASVASPSGLVRTDVGVRAGSQQPLSASPTAAVNCPNSVDPLDAEDAEFLMAGLMTPPPQTLVPLRILPTGLSPAAGGPGGQYDVPLINDATQNTANGVAGGLSDWPSALPSMSAVDAVEAWAGTDAVGGVALPAMLARALDSSASSVVSKAAPDSSHGIPDGDALNGDGLNGVRVVTLVHDDSRGAHGTQAVTTATAVLAPNEVSFDVAAGMNTGLPDTVRTGSGSSVGSLPGSFESVRESAEHRGPELTSVTGANNGNHAGQFLQPGSLTPAESALASSSQVSATAHVSSQIAEAVINQQRWETSPERTELTLQLDPPELGTVQLILSVNRDELSVQIVTQTETARSLVDAQMKDLIAQLQQAGLDFSGCDVFCEDQSAQRWQWNHDDRSQPPRDVPPQARLSDSSPVIGTGQVDLIA